MRALPLATAFALFAAWAPPARAAEVAVEAAGACPGRDAVAAALAGLLVRTRVADAAAEVLLVEDLGARYRATLKGTTQVARASHDWADADRRCAERARAAAVFAALTLEPPELGRPADARAPAHDRRPAPATAAPGAARRPAARRVVEVALDRAGLFDSAPRTAPDATLFSGGAAARLAVGRRYLYGVIGLAALSPVTMALGVGRARLTRVPIDLSVRGRWPLRRVALEGELGVALSPQIFDGLDLASNASALRLDAGLRLGLGVIVAAHPRAQPFLTLSAIVSPRPNDLVIEPLGTVGHAPLIWLTLALGLRLGLRP